MENKRTDILDICIPSVPVREYLKGKLSPLGLARIVCGAAIPLSEKVALLESNALEILDPIIVDMKKACDVIDDEQSGGKYFYTLEDCWYDYDIHRHKEELVGVFENVASAKAYIQKSEVADLQDCSEEERAEIKEAPAWFELRVWEKVEDSGRSGLKECGCFYLVHGEAFWFDRTWALLSKGREAEYEEYRSLTKVAPGFETHYCHESEWLKLPLPFQPGTVLEINPYPFGPKSEGILISYEDINDEDVMVLTRTYEGKWCIVDVAGSLAPIRFKEQEDWISALYRLQETEAKNEEDKRVFDAIGGYIRNNPENAENLLEEIGAREMTDQELWEILEKF